MDDGLGGAITKQITTMVSNDPSLQSHNINLGALTPVGVLGRIYKFKIEAINNAGSSFSNALSVALASLPDKPSTIPYADPDGTNQYQLKILIDTFTSANNGGTPILNYQI